MRCNVYRCVTGGQEACQGAIHSTPTALLAYNAFFLDFLWLKLLAVSPVHQPSPARQNERKAQATHVLARSLRGGKFSCAVLGEEARPVLEFVSSAEFYSYYDAK